MKKFFSVMLAVIVVMALAVTAFADAETETGSITVKNTVKDQSYTVYQMATLDAYVADKGAYLYTPTDDWKPFFDVYTSGDKKYFEYDEGNIILVKEDLTADETAAFAKAALAFAAENEIAPATDAKTATADDQDVVFDGLDFGYYLVDSSLGAFCGLTTTAPDAEVEEKNAAPTVDKLVEEDSTGDWDKENDADLFQTINYKTVITVQKGAMNYVLHDKMEAGLTWNGTVTVTVDGTAVDAANYTLVAEDPETAEAEITDGCTFEVRFADAYVASLADGTEITVAYSAFLNENAEIYDETNDNETWLGYGDENETTHITTETKVYKFSFVKTDAEGAVLDGAKFKLFDSANGVNEIAVVKVEDGVYRIAKDGETGVAIETKNGVATIIGVDGNITNYYIEETEAPAGYNKLTARQEVTIDGANLDVTVTDGEWVGIQIINRTGSELPSTGGFGTTMLIVLGGIVVLGAGVLLFVKKRMSQIAE